MVDSNEPDCFLMIAVMVLIQAAKDVNNSDPEIARDARAWLNENGQDWLCLLEEEISIAFSLN